MRLGTDRDAASGKAGVSSTVPPIGGGRFLTVVRELFNDDYVLIYHDDLTDELLVRSE